MKPKKRQKLCHNCEGEIDLDVIVCPFCAADLREEKPEQERSSFNPAANTFGQGRETSQSLYPSPPLYPPPHSPKTSKAVPASQPLDDPASVDPPSSVAEEEKKNPFAATILFTLGVQLFLLGLLMLLFSHKGAVVLRWDAAYWFLYCLAGIPLLYFGYKALTKL